MSTLAILPIKRFSEAKQRLVPGVSPGLRRLLVEAMLSDVLVALRRIGALEAILAVSSDEDAQRATPAGQHVDAGGGQFGSVGRIHQRLLGSRHGTASGRRELRALLTGDVDLGM